MSRAGSLLIVVAGLCALLAALAVAFLGRMREDAAETQGTVRAAQARLMLMAGCDYLLEAARIGYDRDPALGAPHEEAFGWLDVRASTPAESDFAVGPRDQSRAALFSTALVEDGDGDGVADRPAWPAIGGVARCPMQRLRQPPYAIRPIACTNPIAVDGPDAGLPYLRDPDPQPATANGWPGAVDDAGFAEWARGDARPRPGAQAWFRCRRESATVFVIACGSGTSLGFRDWDEVRGAGATALFADDPGLFAAQAAGEVRQWFRVEWSGAIGSLYDFHFVDNQIPGPDNYLQFPHNATQVQRGASIRSQIRRVNPCGTIRWVQRLAGPPTPW